MEKLLSKQIANSNVDEDRFNRIMARKPSHLNYLIFFTPRSGSSWLVDTLSNTEKLGRPKEWFNPNFTKNTANAIGANTPEKFVNILRRLHKTPNGIFGAKLTYLQYQTVDGINLFECLRPDVVFCLRRRDIVAQAISLYRATSSNIYHNTTDLSDREKASIDDKSPFDAAKIKHWIRHILVLETGMERVFDENNVFPNRFFYEDVAGRTDTAVNFFSQAILGLPLEPSDVLQSSHKQISSASNLSFAERIRNEHSDFLEEIESQRPKF